MATIEITLELDEELVRDAGEFGLLTNLVVTSLLQAEVDRLVTDVVNTEIQAYRREKADSQRAE